MKILIDEAVVRFVMDAIDGFFAAPDDEADQEAQEELLTARSKLRQALADATLDKMADNARELGLGYEQPAPAQEPVAFETREIGEGDWFRVPLKDRARIAGIIESPHMDYRWLCTAPLATAQRITAYYRNVERQPIAVEAAHGITSGEATKKGGAA